MKSFFSLLSIIFLLACQSASSKPNVLKNEAAEANKSVKSTSNNYDKYCNERFDHCIEYPSHFYGTGQSQNGDGQSFLSPDEKTEISFFGSNYDSEFSSIATKYEFALKEGNASYKVKKDNFFVVSGKKTMHDEEYIYYIKTVFKSSDETGDVLLTFRIDYPASQKEDYDAFCKIIDSNLKP